MADDPVVKAVSNRFPSRRHGKHPKKVREEKSKAWAEVKFFGMRLMAMLLILYECLVFYLVLCQCQMKI